MFLSLANEQDLEKLKWITSLEASHRKFPHQAAKKLKEILLDDQISLEDFKTQFNEILATTQTFRWKSFLYVDNLKNKLVGKVSHISWLQILFVVGIFSLGFFIYKTFVSKYPKRRKRLNFVYKNAFNLIERFFAVVAYYPPIVAVYQRYMLAILAVYPKFYLIFPDFIRYGVQLLTDHTELCSYIYFFGAIYLIALKGKPSVPRFIKFHLMTGIFIFVIMNIPDLLVGIFNTAGLLSNEQRTPTALFLFCLYASWILPCLYHAITYTYPKNKFFREAMEIHLGRDDDPDFTWWDRDY